MVIKRIFRKHKSAPKRDVLRLAVPPLQLPLDVVHCIFEFYHLHYAFYPEVLYDRTHAKAYQKRICSFAHVCRDWHTVASGQSSYMVHDLTYETDGGNGMDGRERLEALLEILKDGRLAIGISELCYKTVRGTMQDIPSLVKVVDAVKTTLTFFRLHFMIDDFDDGDEDTYGDNMQLLSRSLSGAERLEQLDLTIAIQIPLGAYLNLIQNTPSLRKCFLDIQQNDAILMDTDSLTDNWRTFPHSSTPWHHLTTLFVYCTTSSLPLISIMLTSGSVTHLQIGGCEKDDIVPTDLAFLDLFSAMEAHCTSLTWFLFNFGRTNFSKIPTLDHTLPFLVSCEHLDINAADLNAIEPLLSLPKLKWLKVAEVLPEDKSDSGISAANLLAFIRQERGVLKTFEVTYDEDEFHGGEIDFDYLLQLEMAATRLRIEFSIQGVENGYGAR